MKKHNGMRPQDIVVLLKIIAYKFNWIEKLGHLSKETSGSTFDSIVDFFYGDNRRN